MCFGFYVIEYLENGTNVFDEWFSTKEEMLEKADVYLEEGYEISHYAVSYSREEIEQLF